MKSFLFTIYLSCIKFLLRFTKTNDNLYVVLNGSGRSGSNGYIFYKYLKKEHPEVEAILVEPWPSSHLSWSTWKKIGQAKYLFTTHEPFKIKKSQVCTCFWHGIPLKRMGFMAANDSYQNDVRNMHIWQKQADRVVSSSPLYETLMTACTAIEGEKYIETGFPRIDALYKPEVSKQELLKDLFETQDPMAKVGIYMPTFRFELNDQTVMDKIKAGNFFAFDDFDAEKLNDALKKMHQYLIIKLHPYEMKLVASKTHLYSNICFLNNSYLFDKKIDLYEMLAATDYLMTDFSSIYFDYLHLDKPVYFITNYLKQYETVRGLLLAPYKDVVPGQCVNNQSQMLEALASNKDNFENARKYWLNLTYTVASQSNCQRNFEKTNS